jgi:hypothetical protein
VAIRKSKVYPYDAGVIKDARGKIRGYKTRKRWSARGIVAFMISWGVLEGMDWRKKRNNKKDNNTQYKANSDDDNSDDDDYSEILSDVNRQANQTNNFHYT